MEWLLSVEIIILVIFLYRFTKKLPNNINLIFIGIIGCVITGTLLEMNIEVLPLVSGISGGALIMEGLKNFLTKEDSLKTAGDWRKNLYKLEQKPYYTIDDLYELNSYINPYSEGNKVSIIVNEVIVNILENHRGEGCVSYKNSDCNNCSDKNDCKDETSIPYDNLRNKMIGFLKNDSLSELKLERTNMTAFDFEVNKTITKTETTKELDNKIKNKEDDGYLTPEENNLVRLACHVLLKAEWREWSK